MLSFSGSLKVYLAVEPCDMRKSFNGLHDAVATRLKADPKSGAIFAFTVSAPRCPRSQAYERGDR